MAIISDDDGIEKRVKKNPIIKPENIEYDNTFENSIRPKDFDSYIGQGALKETLKITLEAAKKRGKPLDHLLFYGPPGLGKTTIAGVIASQMGVEIRITSAPALERPRDIIGILMSLKDGEILFIDEIHRLNKVAEEILYPAMEDFTLDMTTGKSQTAKTLRVPLPKFTLIGATTKAGELSSPLRDRFGMIHRLEFYTVDELAQVVKRTAKILEIEITDGGAKAIAMRSRGTPRIANRLLKRVRDFALVEGLGTITLDITKKSLDRLKVDSEGLDDTDHNLLKSIIYKFNGGPVGIDALAASIGEEASTIEDVYEPYLLQNGFLKRTNRGRVVTEKAYKHLGIDYQKSMFD